MMKKAQRGGYAPMGMAKEAGKMKPKSQSKPLTARPGAAAKSGSKPLGGRPGGKAAPKPPKRKTGAMGIQKRIVRGN